MIDQLFTNLTIALSGSLVIASVAAFAWGALSILLSPCHLSSIPLVIGYISSQGPVRVKSSFSLALNFAVGILITIAIIGLITASLGRLLGDVGYWGNWLVALVFIVVGLYLMDILKLDWNTLNVGNNRPGGLWGAFVLGLVFGVGLGPCTFAFFAPVLGVVFQTANDNWWKAILLISAFGIGHCTIIVSAGSFTTLVQSYLNWTEDSRKATYIKRFAGFLVLLGGVYYILISFNF